MNKRLIVILIIGAFAGLGLGTIWWWSRQPNMAALTEEEVARKYAELHGEASLRLPSEPARAAIDLSHSLRLAVGGLGLADENSNRQLGDLVTVQLNGVAGFELVERQSLSAILQELNLNWSGFVRAKDAVRAGKLLKVDWFLLGTAAKINGTNSIVARVVDARTGAIRDAGVFAEDRPWSEVAANLAAFLRDTRQNAAHPEPKVFLAIGAFEDLSLNDRQADFPQQLRSYLTAAFRGRNVTLLEREYVEALLQEVHLDMAGLTDESWSNSPAAMQSAYWLVDGQYQSYETTNYQIELNLEIQRAFGKSFQRQLRGLPGEPIGRQAKATIDEVMSLNASYGYPTRRGEARMQLATGKELGRIGTWPFVFVNYYESRDAQTAAKEKRRLDEAIRAFQTVLLLEPSNREAKIYLATCLRNPTIQREDEGRNLYREMLEEPLHDKWTDLAQQALVGSLELSGPGEKARWLAAAIQHTTNSALMEFYRQNAGIAARDAAINRRDDNATKPAQERLREHIRSSKDFMDGKTSTLYGDYGLYDFLKAFPSKAAGVRAMADFLPTLETEFPELAPHLAANVLEFQVDTNSAALQEFEKTLDWCIAHPKEVFKADSYWNNEATSACYWLIGAKHYALAVKAMEGCRAAADQKVIEKFEDKSRLTLGYAYMGAERWQEALMAFESFSNKIVRPTSDGPWGQAFQLVLTETEAALCRKKLGLVTVEDPRKFDMGKPVLCLCTPSTFMAEPDGLWVGIGGRLLRLDFELRTNLNVKLPIGEWVVVTAICPTADTIWVGTHGAGLIGFEKATHQCRHLTAADGLMMDDIASLEIAGDSLWIGYGGTTGGGLGQMDLLTGKLTSFMPSINTAVVATGEAAPRETIDKIVAGADGNLWMFVGNGLRQFNVKSNVWKSWPSQTDGWAYCFSSDAKYLVQGASTRLLEIGILDKADRNAPTKDLHRTNQVVTGAELQSLEAELRTNGSHRYVYSKSSGGLRPRGALAIRNFHDTGWTRLENADGFPNPPSTLTLDGDNLWVGGEGAIALVDLKEKKVKKFCHIKANRVDSIQIAGGYVWAQFDWHLYRVPLSTLQ